MNTCETCKHWDQKSSWFDLYQQPEKGVCQKIGDSRDMPDALAETVGYHADDVCFMTKGNFGCIHHEPK